MPEKSVIFDCLSYDKETGLFCRKDRLQSKIGTIDSNGYLKIGVNSKVYYAHRLAWLFEYGAMPINHIDHIDGNKLNNKIENLRDISKTHNLQNVKKPRKNNSIGTLGVSMDGKKFKATISYNGKQKTIGRFDKLEDAQSAYLIEKAKVHPGCVI